MLPPSLALGVLTVILMAVHSAFWLALLYVFALLRLLIAVRPIRRVLARTLVGIARGWVACNRWILWRLLPTRIEVRGAEGLGRDRSWLICSNHRSWVDPLLLSSGLDAHVPFFRFFAKRGLLWVPFFGIAFWALDFPFMRRHSREHLERHPEDRGKDLETARTLGEKFRRNPTSVVSYAEGTRWTPEKHADQESPYLHLLRPRAGGLAYVIAAMGERLAGMVDVTLVYPPGHVSFGRFLCGRLPWIVVDVRKREIPVRFHEGDYLEDPGHREEIQAWIRGIWEEKDRRITEILAERIPGPSSDRS